MAPRTSTPRPAQRSIPAMSVESTAIRLITWGTIDIPFPKLEPSPYSAAFERSYEDYKKARDEYLRKFDAFVTSYDPGLTAAYRELLVGRMDAAYEDFRAASHAAALPLIAEPLERARRELVAAVIAKRQIYSMLDSGEVAMRHLWDDILDKKCHLLVPFGQYVHSVSLVACDTLDDTFKELHQAVEDVIRANRAVAERVERAVRACLKGAEGMDADGLVDALDRGYTLEMAEANNQAVVVVRPWSQATYDAVRLLATALGKIETAGAVADPGATPNQDDGRTRTN